MKRKVLKAKTTVAALCLLAVGGYVLKVWATPAIGVTRTLIGRGTYNRFMVNTDPNQTLNRGDPTLKPFQYIAKAQSLDKTDPAIDVKVDGSLSAARVSGSDLSVPHRARKELSKANASLAKQDLQQALRRLSHAISIYPNYAVAYNNLGVVYAHLGDAALERGALEKAILLNPAFSLAHLNLGRMDIAFSDFPAAENELQKAATLDPREPVTLILLSYVQLMEGHLEDAISTSRDAHRLKKPHAFAHRIAARALEDEKHFECAITELRVSLQEEPTGPRSESARKELAMVRTISR